jgi:hypothetical protein
MEVNRSPRDLRFSICDFRLKDRNDILFEGNIVLAVQSQIENRKSKIGRLADETLCTNPHGD